MTRLLSRPHSNATYLKNNATSMTQQWSLSKLWWDTNDKRIGHRVLLMWMLYIRKHSLLPIKNYREKVEPPFNEARQSNHQFIGNLWIKEPIKGHHKEAISQIHTQDVLQDQLVKFKKMGCYYRINTQQWYNNNMQWVWILF